MKVSKNHVVWARCHLTGLASGIDWAPQSSFDSGAASASVWPRTAWKRAVHRPGSFICMAALLGAGGTRVHHGEPAGIVGPAAVGREAGLGQQVGEALARV